MTLKVTSKFGLCGLPISIDTYKNCSFGCKYCFARLGVSQANVLENKDIVPIDNSAIESRLKRISKGDYERDSFLDVLIADGITWHCGGMSDPWQPAEAIYKSTTKLLGITNRYGITILFSTKTDKVDYTYLKPDLHTFQLSITNINDYKDIEPNVALIDCRYKLFCELKNKGFRVGIRVQPFIPKISTVGIVEKFKDADYFTFEGIKLIPSSPYKERVKILDLLGLKEEQFTSLGLLSLYPDIRLDYYEPITLRLDELNIPYSLADNDLHYISKSKCCCGEPLVNKSTDFNTTAMFFKNKDYTKEDLLQSLGKYADCRASTWIFTHSQGGFKTVKDFFNGRYEDSNSPWSKKFMYYEQPVLFKL